VERRTRSVKGKIAKKNVKSTSFGFLNKFKKFF